MLSTFALEAQTLVSLRRRIDAEALSPVWPGLGRPAAGFRMELYGADGFVKMSDPFIRSDVGIDKVFCPIRRHDIVIERVTLLMIRWMSEISVRNEGCTGSRFRLKSEQARLPEMTNVQVHSPKICVTAGTYMILACYDALSSDEI